MARFYRNLDPSDIRLTPFRAYKRYTGTDSYVTYSALLSTTPLDLGNDALVVPSGSLFTTNNKLKNSIWHSVHAHYFRYYYDNAKASFGNLYLTQQPRTLAEKALVISFPQKNFGEQIEPTSFRAYMSGTYFVDDRYGNIVQESSRWTSGGEISASSVVFATRPSDQIKSYQKTIGFTKDHFGYQYPASLKVTNAYITSSTYEVRFKLDNSAYSTSSIIIEPTGEEVNQYFNFQGKDFAISLTYISSSKTSPSTVLLQKKASTELTGFDDNGLPTYIQLYRYPYKLSHISGSNKIAFEKSDGFTTLAVTSSFNYNQSQPLVLSRSGSQYTLFNGTNSTSFTDTLFQSDRYCVNKAPIYIGIDEFGYSGSVGEYGNIHFYNKAFSSAKYQNLTKQIGYNDPYQTVGIISHKEGIAVVTQKHLISTIESSGISNLQYRGTTTIYENEISCTVSPGTFNFSNNPTAHTYDPIKDEYKLAGFTSGSEFRPFVTRIGLYDDYNQLLLVGTLNQPIQLPQNVDTTFILRYDL